MISDSLLLRASTIDERLSELFEAETEQNADLETASRRLAVWCRASANGDWALFAQRLARDGLSFEDVLPRLGRVELRPGATPPLWACDAEWILKQLGSSDAPDGSLQRMLFATPVAFQDVFLPIVVGARDQLTKAIPGEVRKDCGAAVEILVGRLLERLSELAAPALYDEFLRFRQNRAPGAEGPAVAYEAFVSHLRRGALIELFDRLPVLLRLVAVTFKQWLDVAVEFLSRLTDDLEIIRRELIPEFDLRNITQIDGGLSDHHNGGRSVYVISLSGSERLVYKPKSLDLDQFLADLLNGLAARGAPIDLRLAKSVARGDYGWSEFIAFAPCLARDDVGRYYERAGAWLVLFHLIAATDMHEENIIASGAHPIPIDLEMLFQVAEDPGRIVVPETHAIELAGQKIAESLIMTGMLPDYVKMQDNRILDRGAFNLAAGDNTHLVWENLNTDQMRPRRLPARRQATGNVPEFDGQKVGLAAHLPDLKRGFRRYALFLSRNRDFLSEELQRAAGLRTRAIERPTRFYGLLLERLRNPRNMEDGVAWSANADFVSRVTDMEGSADPLWPLLRSERQALCALNIPYFTSRTDSTEVADQSGVLTHGELIPGLEHALQRVEAFSEAEIEWQATVLTLSTGTVAGPPEVRFRCEPAGDEQARAMSEPSLLGECGAIFSHIQSCAIRSGPGAAWVGLDWLGNSDFCRLVALGPDLYNGNPGVALFLAAYAKTCGSLDAAELALAALSALRHNLKSPNARRYARALGLGGGTGLGGAIYALTTIGYLLESEELVADAATAARLITSELISRDRQYDTLGGAAGATLGLLRLFKATGASFALDRAIDCGDHTLNGLDARQREGATPFGNGMAHGYAGLALAFGRLGATSGLPRFIAAAQACVDHEDRSFSDEHGNWPTLTESGGIEESWPCQWCHGGSGIGLVRTALLREPIDLGARVRQDVLRAGAAAIKAWPYPLDTACCGNTGNLEFLTDASVALGKPEWRALSDARLSQIVSAARERGDYLWNVGDRRFSLGLFRGISGIGYALLRRVNEDLPGYLTWD